MFSFGDWEGLGLCSCFLFFCVVLWWGGSWPPHWHSGPAESDLWFQMVGGGGCVSGSGCLIFLPPHPDFSLRDFYSFPDESSFTVPETKMSVKLWHYHSSPLLLLSLSWVVDSLLPGPGYSRYYLLYWRQRCLTAELEILGKGEGVSFLHSCFYVVEDKTILFHSDPGLLGRQKAKKSRPQQGSDFWLKTSKMKSRYSIYMNYLYFVFIIISCVRVFFFLF